jgi:hypothetical protein
MRAAACLACLVLSGCIVPIPPHHDTSGRRNVPAVIPDWLEPGRTTLAEALFRLGEPDDVAIDERTLGWVSVDDLGGVALFYAAGPGGAGMVVIRDRFRRLVVQFTDDGIVTNRWPQSANCSSGLWGVGNAGEKFGHDCLPPLPDTGVAPPSRDAF